MNNIVIKLNIDAGGINFVLLLSLFLAETQKTTCNNDLCNQYDTEINKIIYKLYDLTSEEVNYIEKC